MPRRSGTMSVCFASSDLAVSPHMSPVSAKPCSRTTAGPCPPIRVWSVTLPSSISWTLKPEGKGWIMASDPLDQCHCGRGIAHLGAGDEIDERVALPGPGLGFLGPFVELGRLVTSLHLFLRLHQAGIGEVRGRLVDLGEIGVLGVDDRRVVF